MSPTTSRQEFLAQATGNTMFSELIRAELEGFIQHDCPFELGSVFICGRYGAGKSTFADFWQGSDFFPSVYHIDSDHLMRRLYEEGLSEHRADTKMCKVLTMQLVEALSQTHMPFTYSFAGKQTTGPVRYRISKTTPGYEHMSDEEKVIPKPVGHMVLCDQEVSLARVRQRQAEGGHPYQELKGDFEDMYRFKQAEIIYGLPSYVEGTDSYIIWDSSESGKQKIIAEVITSEEGPRRFVVHDADRAAHFGLTEDNVRTIFNMYEDYPFIYTKVFGRIVANEFQGEDAQAFRDTCDRLSFDMMSRITDDMEKPLLESAKNNRDNIVFETQAPFEINVFERPVDFTCLNKLALRTALARQNYVGEVAPMPPQAT